MQTAGVPRKSLKLRHFPAKSDSEYGRFEGDWRGRFWRGVRVRIV